MITGYPSAFDEYTSDPKLAVTTVYLEDTSVSQQGTLHSEEPLLSNPECIDRPPVTQSTVSPRLTI